MWLIKGQRKEKQKGSIMLMILVLFVVFISIMSATLRFVIRQSHETVDQEQEEQAFNAADAGVSYAIWLLSSDGGNYQPSEVAGLPTITDHIVLDNNGVQIGTFTLTNIVATASSLAFKSIGKDTELQNRCQAIRVTLRQIVPGQPYSITTWDHQVGYPCS